MFTANFAKLKRLKPRIEAQEIVPISISRGKPFWYKGREYDALAPTWKMLEAERAEYDKKFYAILKKLDPRKVLKDIGENGVMLCWCKEQTRGTPSPCHRFMVADWLVRELKIEIIEL